MMNATAARCVGTIALCSAMGVACLFLKPETHAATNLSAATAAMALATPAVMLDDPNPFSVPEGTELNADSHLLSQPGWIRSATEWKQNGSIPADLRAIGDVLVDNAWRSAGEPIEWDETVDLGGFKNAGLDTATITFSSGLILDVLPGQVVFTSSAWSQQELIDEMIAAAWHCECRCTCQGCPAAPPIVIPCGEVGGDCSEIGGFCQYGECTGQPANCQTWFVYDSTP